MIRPLNRTAWAAIIAALAVGLPSMAWYIAGTSAARQAAEHVLDAPRRQTHDEAERIARRLAVRLEALRQSETRRSFLDYEPHLHELEGECVCEPLARSPLAEGPADPLIWAHFQIDEVGQLTLPTLTGNATDDSARIALSDERAILEVLECAGDDRLSGLSTAPPGSPGERLQAAGSEWVVTVGPFAWHRVSLQEQPALVALRQVRTPTTSLTQGFVIRRDTLATLLEDAPYPAELRPGSPIMPTEALVPIEGESWTIALDPSEALLDAQAAAGNVRTRFRTNFALGMGAALLGAGLVVGLVWQTERLARQRARFAASAAHELRTPLTGLRMYGEMLADEAGDPERRRGYALRVAGEAERLGRVVTNLLGFSKLERGELRLQAVPGDLGAAVREATERLRPTLDAAGATLEVAIADALPPVRFDRDALDQILQNLLDNAARYSRGAEDRTIHVRVSADPDGACLSVVDHGPGVAAALRGKLFQAFVRDPSPDAPDGLGLGLALVQALASAQDATVAHAEVDGGGSRFSVTFPALAC